MQQGDVLGYTYQLLKPIGQGGLGAIWLGYHINLRKYVVIKKVHDRLTNLVNCRIEVDILKSLRHQFLPQVYDFIETGEGIFTVMDYIPGQDLQHCLDAGMTFSEEQLLFWLRELAEVLSYLHSRTPQIIHCDIKPANIMITESGDVCLIDFNIFLDGENSKDLVGVSSRYAAPEQIARAKDKLRGIQNSPYQIDGRTDLYSLGAVFYTLMSRQLPQVRREQGWTLKALEAQGLLPGPAQGIETYSNSLINIIDQLMEEDPGRRTKSAAVLLKQLDHLDRQSDEYKKKQKILWSCVIGGSVLAILLTSVLLISGARRAERAFFESFDGYMQRAQQISVYADQPEELESLVEEGRALLNTSEYQDDFDKYKSEKARVLLSIGQGELLLDHNISALSYLEKAAQLSGDAAIYRDLAIAAARSGDSLLAEDYLWQATSRGLSNADQLLVEAELLSQQGDLTGAYQKAKDAAQDISADEDLMRRAAILAVQLAEQLGVYEDGASFSLRMSDMTYGAASGIWLREAGVLSVKGVQAGKSSLSSTGISAYQSLIQLGYGTLSDYLNEAWLYQQTGDLMSAKEILLSASAEYPDEYEIYLQLSYVSYQITRETTKANRDYSDTRKYFDMAASLYRETGRSISENADLLSMQQIVNELIAGGWLQP